jgi:hypothetical protein
MKDPAKYSKLINLISANNYFYYFPKISEIKVKFSPIAPKVYKRKFSPVKYL